jgi:hypothetical protein
MLPRVLSPEDESFLHAMCVHLGMPGRFTRSQTWRNAGNSVGTRPHPDLPGQFERPHRGRCFEP